MQRSHFLCPPEARCRHRCSHVTPSTAACSLRRFGGHTARSGVPVVVTAIRHTFGSRVPQIGGRRKTPSAGVQARPRHHGGDRMAGLFRVSATVLLLTGCATLRSALSFQEPQIELKEINVTGMGLTGDAGPRLRRVQSQRLPAPQHAPRDGGRPRGRALRRRAH